MPAAQPTRIAILGAGKVGASIAYSLILNPVASEILIVDPKEEMRDAQVMDLTDAAWGGGVTVRAGSHKEAGQCDVVVVSAGAKQKDGESRPALLSRNLGILHSALGDMKPFGENTIILLVANPVDVLAHFAVEISGLPAQRVIGSGTFLDSMRLRNLVSQELGVHPGSMTGFVLGEHGDSQVVAWGSVGVEGVPLEVVEASKSGSKKLDREKVAKKCRTAAGDIIAAKGETSWGIGAVASSICRTILYDRRDVRAISVQSEKYGCSLSLPTVLGREGVVQVVEQPMSGEESKALEKSASALKEMIAEAEKESKEKKKD